MLSHILNLSEYQYVFADTSSNTKFHYVMIKTAEKIHIVSVTQSYFQV